MADFNFYLNRQGIKGRKGDTGEAGFSPIISVKTNTASEYVLSVQNESSSFDTPNLRGNAITNNGGTYIRYNPITEEMYTGYADVASTSALGEVQFSTYAQLENGGVEDLVPSSMDVYDFVISQMQQIGITFNDLTNIMQAGSGIERAIDNTARTITFSANIDLSDVLKTEDISTEISSQSTDDEVASAKAVYNAIAAIPTPDLSNYVTLNTAQSITGLKTFYQQLDIVNNIGTVTHRLDYNGVNSYFRTPTSDMIFIDRNRTLYLKDIVDSSTLATELASKQDNITDTLTLQRTVGDSETTFTLGIEGNTGTLAISAQKENTISGVITSTTIPSFYSVTATGATVTTTDVQDSLLGLGRRFAITVPQATTSTYGIVRPDNSTIKIDGSGLLYANLSDLANKNLSNLSNTGEERLHALKGYLEEVEPLTDSEGYNDLAKGLHSTFDRSKFTVVGSPNITDDGVVSGFGASNFLKNTTISFTPNKELIFTGKYIYKTATTEEVIFASKYGNSPFVGIGVSSNSIISRVWKNDTRINISHTLSDGDILEYRVTLTPSLHKLECSINGATQNPVQNVGTYEFENINLLSFGGLVNAVTNQISNASSGSIDIKHSSITVDGVEVFSGNRTGIDTIKPDDYTVVGSPTISADGVITSGDYQNYVNLTTLDLTGRTCVVEGRIIVKQLQIPSSCRYINIGTGFLMYGYTGNNNILQCNINGTWSGVINITSSNLNIPIDYKLNINTNSYSCIFYQNGRSLGTLTGSNMTALTSGIEFAVFKNNAPSTIGFIETDLNSIKVYVDGNLVYQPCLKIPYTLSIYGDMITDIQYISRIQDAFNQTGNCNEAVIDTENKIYYLPAGNIYGKLNRLVSGLGDVSATLDAINGEEV